MLLEWFGFGSVRFGSHKKTCKPLEAVGKRVLADKTCFPFFFKSNLTTTKRENVESYERINERERMGLLVIKLRVRQRKPNMPLNFQ